VNADLESVGKLIPLVRLGYGQLFTHIIDPDLAQIITFKINLNSHHYSRKMFSFTYAVII
jgi:hypothetical protein